MPMTAWVPAVPTTPIRPDQLDALTQLTGLDSATLRAMTWTDYPAIGIGHRRRQRWLVDAPWACPCCQPTRERWNKAWETGLSPCCPDCEVLLVDLNEPRSEPVPAPPELLDLSQYLLARVERSRTTTNAVAQLRRMHRMCCLVAATIDQTWPPRPATELLTDYTDCRTWLERPPTNPTAVAEVLIATLSDRHHDYARWLQIEGTRRLKARPSGSTITRAHLPKRRRAYGAAWAAKASPDSNYPGRGHYSPPVTRPTSDSRRRYEALARDLHRSIAQCQIPGLAPLPGDGFLPAPEQWPQRHDLALAIDVILNTDDRGRPGLLWDAHEHFHEPNAAPSLLLRDLANRHVSSDTDEAIRATLPLIAQLPDLAARRHLLHQHRTLPAQWHRIVPHGTDPALSHGWIWCYLTLGDLRGAPTWAKPDGWFPGRTIWDFHHQLPTHTLLDMAHAADDFLNPRLDTHTGAASAAVIPPLGSVG